MLRSGPANLGSAEHAARLGLGHHESDFSKDDYLLSILMPSCTFQQIEGGITGNSGGGLVSNG
jgi:hypothetical protein